MEFEDSDVIEMPAELGEELVVGHPAVVVDQAIGVGQHGPFGFVVGARRCHGPRRDVGDLRLGHLELAH